MKELNKNEIYSLEGLNEEQLREVFEYCGSSFFEYFKDSDYIRFRDVNWSYGSFESNAFGISKKDITAKAIDLFDVESDFKTITDSIASLLEYKNEKYGNAALEPLKIFTNKTQVGQRIDDKLARIKNSDELRKNDVADLIGYLLLECKFRGWNNFDEFKD